MVRTRLVIAQTVTYIMISSLTMLHHIHLQAWRLYGVNTRTVSLVTKTIPRMLQQHHGYYSNTTVTMETP